MDDQTFDKKTALEWIKIIEAEPSPRDKDIYPMLCAWLNETAATEILEIGCGQGIASERIAPEKTDLTHHNYTGVDPSPFLIDRAKQLYPSPTKKFILGNAYDLPFVNGTFDAAYSISVWHLLQDIQKASAELGRVLKENGKLLIITANPNAYTLWTDKYTDIQKDGLRFEGNTLLNDQSLSRDVLFLHTFDEIQIALQFAYLHIEKTEVFRSEHFLMITGKKLKS